MKISFCSHGSSWVKFILVHNNVFRAVLLKIHDKFKECRKLCNEQEDTRQQAEKQKNQKLFSADSILYKFAINLVSDTACADTSGELEKDELKTKYLTARTLLKVSRLLL